ncbi:hypothetical protein C8F04DRAFT_495771 [Mycena alexandri]|uniref:Uncharacterized protein n=1 Tax=Mycena alexandri TaxID=1745969 RepID=A0AAD6RWV5_9AGAR|nr:hypothetical protein C8F04DRAFT_495771 [Mycena alexandri]
MSGVRRDAGCVMLRDTSPCTGTARPRSYSLSFLCDGDVGLRCDGTLLLAPRIAFLPSSSLYPARSRVLPRLPTGTPTPYRPHIHNSHAAPGAAPPTCVQLDLKTVTRVLSLGGMDKVGNGKAREPLPPVPHTRALPLGRAFLCVCALGTRPVTRHAVQRALSPLETPTRTYSRPPPPSHARASLVYPSLIPPCLCFRGEGGESGGEWSWGWNGVLIISARPLFLIGAPAQFRAFGSAASSSRLVGPLACIAACGTRLLRRVLKGARDGPACAGKWNSDARRPSRPLHPRPPAPPRLVLLIHRGPRSSSHPRRPVYIRIKCGPRTRRGCRGHVCAPVALRPRTHRGVPAVGIECRMHADRVSRTQNL